MNDFNSVIMLHTHNKGPLKTWLSATDTILRMFLGIAGTARYTLNKDGLIQSQEEEWGTPSWKVLLDSLTPSSPPQ